MNKQTLITLPLRVYLESLIGDAWFSYVDPAIATLIDKVEEANATKGERLTHVEHVGSLSEILAFEHKLEKGKSRVWWRSWWENSLEKHAQFRQDAEKRHKESMQALEKVEQRRNGLVEALKGSGVDREYIAKLMKKLQKEGQI